MGKPLGSDSFRWFGVSMRLPFPHPFRKQFGRQFRKLFGKLFGKADLEGNRRVLMVQRHAREGFPRRIILEALRNAKKLRRNWLGIARALEEGLARLDPAERPAFFVAAADASGYSPKLLRRYLAAKSFADMLISEGHASASAFERAPFVLVEHLSRGWDVNAPEVIMVLRPALAGELTIRQLIGRMTRAGPQSEGGPTGTTIRHHRKSVQHSVLSAIEKRYLTKLTGSDTSQLVRLHRPLSPYVAVDAVVIGEERGRLKWVDAVSVKEASSLSSARMLRIVISELALSSSFFRHHWLILAIMNETTISSIVDAVDYLDLSTCGVAIMRPRDLDIILAPSGRLPVPNRTRDLVALVRRRRGREL